MNKDLNKVHFIGIGGAGMSGLARILLSKKIKVSGSDISSSYITQGLAKVGARITLTHDRANIQPDMTVVYNTDIKPDNVEFTEALRLQCPLLHRSDLLQQLMKDYKLLAITGTHGKTTTSALLTSVLKFAQRSPSFAIGGILPQYETNAEAGDGEFFVAEACESDGTFLKYSPYAAIITNIDNDHISFYETQENLIEAFGKFIAKVKNKDFLFWCGDDPYLSSISKQGISYGFSKGCELHIEKFHQQNWRLYFDMQFQGKQYKNIEIPLIGKHNVLNAAAVFGLLLSLGISETIIRSAFLVFDGVKRRCENKGSMHEILFLDDYAHHPTEIAVTLAGIRSAVKERRLIAVYQPHRYSRIKECLGQFGSVFEEVDEVIITDLFDAGEAPINGVSAKEVLKEVKEGCRKLTRYVAREALSSFLADHLRPYDVLVTMGAGDVTKVSTEVLGHIKSRQPKKWKIGVIYGGKSTEHEVSILSAQNIIHSLRSDIYEIIPFGISKKGHWHALEVFEQNKEIPENGEKAPISFDTLQKIYTCDVMIPVLHGPNGEDGTIQGFFEMIGIAYVGCDYRSGAIAMDKALTKKLCQLAGLQTSPFVEFSYYEWKNNKEEILRKIGNLQAPLFVKPLHLGSSIGVNKVISKDDLLKTVENAFAYDDRILVEQEIKGREIEFAVLGNDEVQVFPPGEVFSNGKIYDYEGKYGVHSIQTTPKADLSQELLQEGLKRAKIAYEAIGCKGLARVDFFLDQKNQFWLNEINPMPGFTANSLFPKVCEQGGIGGNAMTDKMILLALERRRNQCTKVGS